MKNVGISGVFLVFQSFSLKYKYEKIKNLLTNAFVLCIIR